MSEKTKVLMEFETFGQTAQMNYNSLTAMAEIYPMEIRAVKTKRICAKDIMWCDIVISVRGMSCFTTYIAQLCKKYGRPHIYLLDDNLFVLDRKDRFMVRRQKELQKTLDATAILWSPNPLLIEYVCSRSSVNRSACTGWIVPENALNENFYGCDTEFRIAYYSNDGSSTYFWNILGQVLPRLKDRVDKKVTVEVIGMHDTGERLDGCNMVFVPHMSLVEFRRYLANGGFHVGLAPLIKDDGFSKYKYANKFFELTMAGIVGIYSNCPPNTFMVQDGYNGFLVENTPKEWLEALEIVAENPRKAEECLVHAQEKLKEEHYPRAVYKSIVEQIPELVSYHAPKVKIHSLLPGQIKFFVFRTLEKLNSFMEALRRGGMQEALKKTKRFISSMRGMRNELQENRR